MLQWEWPKVWGTESREAVRAAMETAIRNAMAGGKNAQIRGTVTVDMPHLGSTPPELILSGIRAVSMEHTAVMLKVRYDGDFSVTMRGLEINLDTIGSSGDESDENLALPFFCPLEITIKNILIDGMVSVEIFQAIESTPTAREGGSGPVLSSLTPQRDRQGMGLPHTSSSQLMGLVRSPRTPKPLRGTGTPPPGYGVLLGAGGRRTMRSPGDLLTSATTPASSQQRAPSPDPMPGAAGASKAPTRHAIVDLLSRRAVVRQRTAKIQFFGDPLKGIRVVSNFGSVPGADGKVEGTIRMLIRPAIERMMTDGLTIHL